MKTLMMTLTASVLLAAPFAQAKETGLAHNRAMQQDKAPERNQVAPKDPNLSDRLRSFGNKLSCALNKGSQAQLHDSTNPMTPREAGDAKVGSVQNATHD